jgi:hypothetical protein
MNGSSRAIDDLELAPVAWLHWSPPPGCTRPRTDATCLEFENAYPCYPAPQAAAVGVEPVLVTYAQSSTESTHPICMGGLLFDRRYGPNFKRSSILRSSRRGTCPARQAAAH